MRRKRITFGGVLINKDCTVLRLCNSSTVQPSRMGRFSVVQKRAPRSQEREALLFFYCIRGMISMSEHSEFRYSNRRSCMKENQQGLLTRQTKSKKRKPEKKVNISANARDIMQAGAGR